MHSAELLRAHSGERLIVLTDRRALPLLHPAASLCALSAHTLHKAGEVLTFSDQIKQTLEGAIEMFFSSLATKKTAADFHRRTFVLSDRNCASTAKVDYRLF